MTTTRDARAGDEPLPFTISLQDVFLTLGVIIFLIGAGLGIPLLSAAVPGLVDAGARATAAHLGVQSAVLLAVVAALSHVLVGVRRRSLPGIVLSIAFVGAVAGLYVAWAVALTPSGMVSAERWGDMASLEAAVTAVEADASDETLRAAARTAVGSVPLLARLLFVGLPLTLLIAALGYYRAYRLPFATALVASAGVALASWVLLLVLPYDRVRLDPILTLGFGVVLLGAAIAYDARDPERTLRWSNNGFWLHLVAAPTLMSGALDVAAYGPSLDVVGLVNGEVGADRYTAGYAAVTLVVVALLAVVSLLLNRRALVVAGLFSAGSAIGFLLYETGADGLVITAVTLLILGGGVLLLGIGWHAARAALLAPLPAHGVWGRVFPRTGTDD